MLAYIWAEDENHYIGLNGHLPWHLPADLAYFKQQTLFHSLIMGYRTFQSLPYVLPHRQHIVLTHHHLKIKNVKSFNSVKELKQWLNVHHDQLIFVIGGASLFKLFKNEVTFLYQTKIADYFKGDLKMPSLDWNKFELLKQTFCSPDALNPYFYEFNVYQRK